MTNEWFERVGMSGLGWRTSKETTYDVARMAIERGIPGDFVECGVYAGASCALMAKAIMQDRDIRNWSGIGQPEPRIVHLFDTFAGIPPLGEHDDPKQAKEGEAACSREDVLRNMKDWGIPDELIELHPGLFSERIPYAVGAGIVKQIAVLRLDGDLYESTRTSIEQLYPLVSPGGYVIVDDFDLAGCRKAILEYFSKPDGSRSAPAPIIWRKPH